MRSRTGQYTELDNLVWGRLVFCLPGNEQLLPETLQLSDDTSARRFPRRIVLARSR